MSQQLPLNIGIAPFPEGFQGDMDETFQQAVQLMEAFIDGNFLTGLILPPGSTLPTSDQGPVAMGNQWYFWDSATSQYLPQTVSVKAAKNFVKNCVYQVQQLGSPTIGAGITKTFDMALCRAQLASILTIAPDVGPAATPDNDYCPSAIKYTVGPSLVPTPGAGDIYAHEHLIEGSDIAMIQGEILSLSFSFWTNVPGTYSAYLTSSGRDRSYVVNFTIGSGQINTWVRLKFPAIPALPTAGGTWSFADGTTGLYIGIGMLIGTQWQTTTPNQWVPVFAGGTSTNSNFCTVVNNQIKISGLKLEASPACSYVSVPSFSADYEEAIRYYFTTFNYQSVTAGCPIESNTYAANQALFTGLFPKRMAKVPTVVPYGWTSHTVGNITNFSSGIDYPVATLSATAKGVAANITTGITGAKGDTFLAIIAADSRLS